MSIKKQYNKKRINPEEWTNINTGETMDSAYRGITSLNVQREDLVIVDSKEYVVIDSRALQYIYANFTPVEVGRITKMADMVKGCYNLLHDKDNKPHTKESLMEELEYTRNIFADFMKKLYNKSVISYIKSVMNGKEVTFVMLNPTLARKTKSFNRDCLLAFEDLSK